jgi:hypothetical protein
MVNMVNSFTVGLEPGVSAVLAATEPLAYAWVPRSSGNRKEDWFMSSEYEQNRDKVIEHLKTIGGKGADTTANIGKAVGLKRRDASKVLAQMEQEGIIMATGVTAGVAGYKLK